MLDGGSAYLIEMQSISKPSGRQVCCATCRCACARVGPCADGRERGREIDPMKILAGVHNSDAGQILKDGKPLHLSSPRAALAAGISTVFQELSLLPNLTIAENMFLGREPVLRGGGLDRRRMRAETPLRSRSWTEAGPRSMVST